jgi:hypothetical protein
MKTLSFMVIVSTLAVVPVEALAGVKYSSQQCNAWFAKIDRNKDGSIGPNENAASFYDRITLAGSGNDRDDSFIMGKAFFVAECKIGSLGKPKT